VQSLYNLPGSFDELGSREDNAALLDKAGVKAERGSSALADQPPEFIMF
jgi:hypothetical protein